MSSPRELRLSRADPSRDRQSRLRSQVFSSVRFAFSGRTPTKTPLEHNAKIAHELALKAFAKPNRNQVWRAFVHLWHDAAENCRLKFPRAAKRILAPHIDKVAEE